jgi:hypothetical protein
MTDTNYLARVEQAVKDGITPDTRVIAVQEWEIEDRSTSGYWERVYIVAWTNEDESGTHRANIDSEGRSALFSGEYLHSEAAARCSFFERVGRGSIIKNT